MSRKIDHKKLSQTLKKELGKSLDSIFQLQKKLCDANNAVWERDRLRAQVELIKAILAGDKAKAVGMVLEPRIVDVRVNSWIAVPETSSPKNAKTSNTTATVWMKADETP